MSEKRRRTRSVVALRWTLARSVPAFYVVFSLYAAAAAFLLLLGLGSALAAASPSIFDVLQDAAGGGSRFAPMWRVIVQSAPLSEAPGQVLLDYLLSGVNLGKSRRAQTFAAQATRCEWSRHRCAVRYGQRLAVGVNRDVGVDMEGQSLAEIAGDTVDRRIAPADLRPALATCHRNQEQPGQERGEGGLAGPRGTYHRGRFGGRPRRGRSISSSFSARTITMSNSSTKSGPPHWPQRKSGECGLAGAGAWCSPQRRNISMPGISGQAPSRVPATVPHQ
jgi:hypothetical protein